MARVSKVTFQGDDGGEELRSRVQAALEAETAAERVTSMQSVLGIATGFDIVIHLEDKS